MGRIESRTEHPEFIPASYDFSGSGSANALAIWTDASTLSYDDALTYASGALNIAAPDTDHGVLNLISSSTTGTVRQYFKNSDASRHFEFDADFTGSAEYLFVQSDSAGVLALTRAGQIASLNSITDAATPNFTFYGDLDTGIARLGANQLALCTAGVAAVSINSVQRTNFAATMGIGGAARTDTILTLAGIAGLTGGDQTGFRTAYTISSAGTGGSAAYLSLLTTADAAFTCPYLLGFFAQNPVKGAASTITRVVHYYFDAPTVGGTGNAVIANNLAFSGNWFINYNGSLASTIGGIVAFPDGVKLKVSTANVSNPPTDADLISVFGAAATVGAGFMAIVDDNNGHANEYLIWSDGTKYWQITATAAA